MKEILKQIDLNQRQIENYGKLSEDVLKKINYRIRLDWNYYSNRMEGGTLTRSETRDVMVGIGVIKPIKDVTEMNGHDKVVLDLLKIGKGDLRISEKRIKDIHTAIMYEDNDKLKKEIGQWKSEPNEIINYKNEKVRFSEPADVAEEMHKMTDWLNAEIDHFYHPKKEALHPVILAAKFHIKFVSIHPFYDGNGRTARILTNLILISLGYPPIVIKDEHRKEYYSLLGDIQSYGGESDLFYKFIGERVIETQNIYLKAVAGESIDEEDDLDKRLKLLEQQFEAISEEDEVKELLTKHTVDKVINNGWFIYFIVELVPEILKFERFFLDERHLIFAVGSGERLLKKGQLNDSMLDVLRKRVLELKDGYLDSLNLGIQLNFLKFRKGGMDSFDMDYHIDVDFSNTNYKVSYAEHNAEKKETISKTFCKKLLSQPLTEPEIKLLAKNVMMNITSNLEHKIAELNRKKTSN